MNSREFSYRLPTDSPDQENSELIHLMPQADLGL